MAKIELREGWREVPDHVAALLVPHHEQLYRLTYEQAIELANREMVRSYANEAQNKAVTAHLRRFGN